MGRPALAAGFLDARHLKDDLQAAARTANLTGKKQPERSATTQTRNWVWACREHADNVVYHHVGHITMWATFPDITSFRTLQHHEKKTTYIEYNRNRTLHLFFQRLDMF